MDSPLGNWVGDQRSDAGSKSLEAIDQKRRRLTVRCPRIRTLGPQRPI
jgi:hypothetical protein